MKRFLVVFLLLFVTSSVFARSNRFDSSIYNQCVQYYKTQIHNAEAQAGQYGLGFSDAGSQYLNSLPSDDEIEEQCEYDAENREDRNSWSYYHQLALNAANRDDYESVIEYLEKAIYYEPVGSEVYNVTYNEIQEAKNILREEQRQSEIQQRHQEEQNQKAIDKVNSYINAGNNYWQAGQLDKALAQFQSAKNLMDSYTAISWYTDGQSVEESIAMIKQQIKEAEKQEQNAKDWEQGKKYFDLGGEELNKLNFDQAIYYFEKSLEYVEKGSETYTQTKNLIKTIKEAQEQMEKDAEVEINKQKSQSTNIDNIPELNQAILWMYEKGLTIFNEPVSFMASNGLRRDEAAKFFVQYAKQVMGKTPDYTYQGCNFKDLNEAWSDLKDVIVESCQLGLFQGHNGKFMPTQQLTNAQAITVFMRLLEGYKDESGTHFANNYYESAHNQGFLQGTPLDNKSNFDNYTTRGNVAKMLFRGQKK